MAEVRLRAIPARWLVERVGPDTPEFEHQRARFAAHWRPGDEVWHYAEPVPKGINAGEMGVALVRGGVPVHAVMIGIR